MADSNQSGRALNEKLRRKLLLQALGEQEHFGSQQLLVDWKREKKLSV